jgi:hypothetical protein
MVARIEIMVARIEYWWITESQIIHISFRSCISMKLNEV